MKETVPSNILESISIDCTVFGFDSEGLKILLIKRKFEPEKGSWALPGGFIMTDENLQDSAQRILQSLTGADKVYMEQVECFGDVDRYPLRRVLTISYFALIKPDLISLAAGAEADEVQWFLVKDIPKLPFDHSIILNTSLSKLRARAKTKPIGFELLAKKFTLTELQTMYEAIFGREFDKRNFRKKILHMKILHNTKEKQIGVAHRAAELFSFNIETYNLMKEDGFIFDL